jgi:hypothetical protein
MSKSRAKPTIGADPEVLILKNFKPVPAWDYTLGRKDAPVPFYNSDYGTFLGHSDNVAFELNFPKQVIGEGRFHHSVAQIVHYLSEKFTWKAVPYAEFTSEQLAHPLASTAGCSEDFSAYDEDPTTARVTPAICDWGQKRFFGGHIHIGHKLDIEPAIMARFCDLYLSLPAISGKADIQGPRRVWYGRAGVFRPKPYGMEYRTLSNFWMDPLEFNHRSRAIDINTRAMLSLLTLNRQKAVELYNEFPWPVLQDAINEENVDKCGEMMEAVTSWTTKNLGPGYIPTGMS